LDRHAEVLGRLLTGPPIEYKVDEAIHPHHS
jgi:hypothetical protein